uniref:Ovule protein n=1 Tax=Steinernema glaseri TaxID=37863 RepID=A0A1I7YWD7_9BILA
MPLSYEYHSMEQERPIPRSVLLLMIRSNCYVTSSSFPRDSFFRVDQRPKTSFRTLHNITIPKSRVITFSSIMDNCWKSSL